MTIYKGPALKIEKAREDAAVRLQTLANGIFAGVQFSADLMKEIGFTEEDGFWVRLRENKSWCRLRSRRGAEITVETAEGAAELRECFEGARKILREQAALEEENANRELQAWQKAIADLPLCPDPEDDE